MTDRERRGRDSHRRGIVAEEIAVRALEAKGYTVRGTRQRTPHGEIDIIAEQQKTLVFVEVKARPTAEQALASITNRQWTRLAEAAVYYTATLFPQTALGSDPTPDMRFDVIAVDATGRVEHIENARSFDEW